MLAASLPAFGQPVDEESRRTARELGRQGQDLFKDGKYEEALDDFEHANAVMHLPVLGFLAAQCLEKLGRLEEAYERCELVAGAEYNDTGLTADQKQKQEDAKLKAASARQLLLPRIPRLTVVVDGPTANEVEIALDGHIVPANMGGRAVVQVNPGKHSVRAQTPSWNESKSLNLAEGASQTISFFAPPTTTGADQQTAEPIRAARPMASSSPRRHLPASEAEQQSERNPSSTPGWSVTTWSLLIGGAASLLTGGVTGAVAWSKKSNLESRCPGHTCPPDAWSDADRYQELKTISTWGIGVGAVLAGAGLVSMWFDSKPSDRNSSRTSIGVGPMSASMRIPF